MKGEVVLQYNKSLVPHSSNVTGRWSFTYSRLMLSFMIIMIMIICCRCLLQ